MAVRRADALVELAGRALDDPELPTLHRRRPHVQVTVDLATLLGLAEHPGELAGYGPIPASAAARALAADGEWRRLVTDPMSGTLLDRAALLRSPGRAGRLRHRPGRQLSVPALLPAGRALRPRPRVSRENGGRTDRDNLGPLCRRHHRLKTRAGWALRRNARRRDLDQPGRPDLHRAAADGTVGRVVAAGSAGTALEHRSPGW